MTTTPTTATAARLAPADLERLELAARADLTGAIVNLTRLREGAAHDVAGFPAWHDYVLARFGDLLAELGGVVLPVAERQELVASMRAAGPDGRALSLRTISDRLHVGLGTVAADVKELRATGRLTNEPTRTASRDGRDRPARTGTDEPAPAAPALPAGLSRTLETLLRVARAGTPGLTSIELDAATGWPMGTATGLLSRLHRTRGLLTASDQFRGGRVAYVLTDAGRDALEAALTAPASTPAPVEDDGGDHGARFVWESGDPGAGGLVIGV
jgi:hypothetical protein